MTHCLPTHTRGILSRFSVASTQKNAHSITKTNARKQMLYQRQRHCIILFQFFFRMGEVRDWSFLVTFRGKIKCEINDFKQYWIHFSGDDIECDSCMLLFFFCLHWVENCWVEWSNCCNANVLCLQRRKSSKRLCLRTHELNSV